MGLVVIPVYLFVAFLNVVVSRLIAKLLFKQSWSLWALLISFLFTFGTRLPDFLDDLIDAHESVYVIHKPIALERESTVGLVGGMSEYRTREHYFAISGLNGGGGSPRWGAPNVGSGQTFSALYGQFDILKIGEDETLQIERESSHMPVVVSKHSSDETHDTVEIEVWHEGELRAKYSQRQRIWFSDELWANANKAHTLLFLLKATFWNVLLIPIASETPDANKFLREAIVVSNHEKVVSAYQSEVTLKAATEDHSDYFEGKRSRDYLHQHCSRPDFPADLSLGFRLKATMGNLRISRYIPDPVLQGYSKRSGVDQLKTPNFINLGLSCGEHGYAVLQTVSRNYYRYERYSELKLYYRLLLLDRDFKALAALDSELKGYSKDQLGRALDFRQVGNAVTIDFIVRGEDGQEQVQQLELKHPLLAQKYATDAPVLGEISEVSLHPDTITSAPDVSDPPAEEPERIVEDKYHDAVLLTLEKNRKAASEANLAGASALESYPKANQSWGDRYIADLYLPSRGFLALYLNTKNPNEVIYREEVGQISIDYIYDQFKSIPSRDFGAFWYGRLEVLEDTAYEVKVNVSRAEARIMVDEFVVYETGRRLPNPILLSPGTYAIRVEYTNNWHTTDFTANVVPRVSQ